MNIFTFFCLSFLTLNGVFGDEVKSVMEGDSVTLHTDIVKQKDDVILWCYGPENMLVAKTNGKVGSEKYYDGDDGRFRNRVKLDDQTGDLTITNMRTEHSGLYTLKISKKKISYKKFNVTVYGVGFGDAEEVKSVSVMEGDSVTLDTDLTHIQTDETIIWLYGPENTLVAKIHGKVSNTEYYGDDERFRDRVKLNDQTGSLTITNIKFHHSGLYTLKISTNNGILHKKFSVTVHARLPVPVIYSSQRSCSERSSCMLLCSVMNVSHDVSVSWYKGKSLLSSIRVSDQKNIFLPLEVEYQDTNTYRCVVNNPITNLTQHLDIDQLCHMSSESPGMRVFTIAVAFTLLVCVILIIVGVYKHKKVHPINTSHSKVPLTDEERSITSEDTEAS